MPFFCMCDLCMTILHILQRVQNRAARLILRFGRSEHIPSVFYFHWLPVKLRVDYVDHAPPHSCELITKYGRK